MEFLRLKEQQATIYQPIKEGIERVLAHGSFIRGPEIFELESQLAQYTGVKHAIALASGTVALHVALLACGVGPGDEVITSPFSFFATVETILLVGAKPVFVDIDPLTYNIDARLIESAITSRTKAIMPVDLYGQCADYTRIMSIAEAHHIPVIADAAQSFGSTQGAQRVGNLGSISCTSFFPSKPLGCYGDGGACFTNNDAYAQSIRQIIDHGQDRRYHHVRLGINGRMASIQAAILLVKLSIFEQEFIARQQVASWYHQELASLPVQLPMIAQGSVSVYALYTIRIPQRTAIQAFLNERGIPTTVHYPVPMHKQPALSAHPYGDFPIAEEAAEQVLSLPFDAYLTQEDVVQVAVALGQALELAQAV